ncbi:MAG TPA: DUF5615 family PIN-like protein [Solirubrobacteraceae bacterium]|nr:DUF5615 family PIN-like protein [Solirubrobacteraceae bacterium]
MKALLDEQLSPQIARVLRERGLDVEAVAERADLPQASDSEILDAAAREQRAVVTNNTKDFRPIAGERLTDGRGHAGLILLPARRSRSRHATGALADAIEDVMRTHPGGIAGAERWIAPLA